MDEQALNEKYPGRIPLFWFFVVNQVVSSSHDLSFCRSHRELGAKFPTALLRNLPQQPDRQMASARTWRRTAKFAGIYQSFPHGFVIVSNPL